MRLKQKVSVGAGLALISLVVLLNSTIVYAVDSGSIGGKPANPRPDNPRSESIFVYELEAGDSVNDEVLIMNNTNDTRSVEVYATDSLISSGGAFACEQKADQADAEGTWIELEKNSVRLKANGSEKVAFTVTVPENTSPGEHNACIAIQAVEAPVASGVNGVQLSFRSAIRVAVTVPGEITKLLEFVELKAFPRDEDILQVTPVLKNNGNVSLDTDLATRVKTVLGNSIETIEGTYPILAGQRTEFNFEFRRPFWGGFYRVVSQATYNTDKQTTLGEDGSSKETITTDKYIFIIPQPGAVVIELLLLAALIAGILWFRRRRRYMQLLNSSVHEHKLRKKDTIMNLAAEYKVAWQDIARLNNLRAPYVLVAGKTIHIPGSAKNLPSLKAAKKPTTAKTQKKTKRKKNASKKTGKTTSAKPSSTKKPKSKKAN